MDCCPSPNNIDQGAKPFVTNLKQDAINNTYFRAARWTCRNMQLTLMSVPVNSDIGLDVHLNADQFFYIERGDALVVMGSCEGCINYQSQVYNDYAILVPAGIWHNIINIGAEELKMFSVYAPALHPHGSIYESKEQEELYEHF